MDTSGNSTEHTGLTGSHGYPLQPHPGIQRLSRSTYTTRRQFYPGIQIPPRRHVYLPKPQIPPALPPISTHMPYADKDLTRHPHSGIRATHGATPPRSSQMHNHTQNAEGVQYSGDVSFRTRLLYTVFTRVPKSNAEARHTSENANTVNGTPMYSASAPTRRLPTGVIPMKVKL